MVFQIITPAKIGSEYGYAEIEILAAITDLIQHSLIYAI